MEERKRLLKEAIAQAKLLKKKGLSADDVMAVLVRQYLEELNEEDFAVIQYHLEGGE